MNALELQQIGLDAIYATAGVEVTYRKDTANWEGTARILPPFSTTGDDQGYIGRAPDTTKLMSVRTYSELAAAGHYPESGDRFEITNAPFPEYNGWWQLTSPVTSEKGSGGQATFQCFWLGTDAL